MSHCKAFVPFSAIAITLHLIICCSLYASDVKSFGAVGDGIADDTAAVQRAINETVDGEIQLPRGDYRITESLEVNLKESGRISLNGLGGAGRIIMEGPGPALIISGNHQGTAGPDSFQPETWQHERMPQLHGLEIIGAHPEADGIQFIGVMQPTLHAVLIREVRHAVILSKRNRNLLISACHIYNCSGIGVFFDHVNLHQAIIQGSHISYCKQGGIKILNGEIRNFQVTGNDIEYNYAPESPQSADICIDLTDGTVAEGTITGNTIQAKVSPGGANIRFVGQAESSHPTPMSMWTITGNLIGSQETNIHLVRCRGMTISANHIYSASKRTIVLDDCRNMIVGANSLDQSHNQGLGFQNGVTVQNSKNVVINALVLDDCAAGESTSGGAIEVFDSQQVTISNCHISQPAYRGIWVAGSSSVQLLGNQVTYEMAADENNDKVAEPAGPFVASIEVVDASGPLIIKDNIVSRGTAGEIVLPKATGNEDSDGGSTQINVLAKDNLLYRATSPRPAVDSYD